MKHTAGILGNVNIDLLMGPFPGYRSLVESLWRRSWRHAASGASGYTAIALDRLGLPSLCVGTVGDDMWGGFIRRQLAEYP